MYFFCAAAIIFYISSLGNVDAQYQGHRLDCNTPDGAAGICIGIRQCTPIISALQTQPLNTESVEYLRESQCGFEGKDPRVCCPLPSTQNEPIYPGTVSLTELRKNETNNENDPISDLLESPLLPSECSKDFQIRIVGGKQTSLEEFPWMALLEYERPTGPRTTSCGGVLISKRYVLTAAHCLKGKELPTSWRLASVRLGEYDTESDQDCIEQDNVVICADNPISVDVEEQIPHELYRPLSVDRKYDIALLRLSRDIVTTNYIKPICLPRSPFFGEEMVVAGWGKTENKSASNIKLKLSLPLTNQADCERIYGRVGVSLGFGQICAGGQKGKDSCRGDSGGPLMSVERYPDGSAKWSAVGVVSFGPSPCGMAGWPGVYTKVYDYLPWIVSKLRE